MLSPLAMDDAPEPASAKTKRALKVVHERALRRFTDLATPAQMDMRRQSLEARRFVSIPGAMWEGAWGEQFENSPRLEVNKVYRGVRKIDNDYRQNRLAVDFRTASIDADGETADTLDGVYRADDYAYKAQQARDNAVMEAIKGGFGAYRLANVMADPGDPENDNQRVNPGLIIPDADQSVFFDPDSKLYDKSDARYAFIVTAQTKAGFEDEWGADKATSWPDGVAKPFYDWFTHDVARVAEYYEVEEENAKLWIFTRAVSSEEERWFEDEVTREDWLDMRAKGWTRKARTVTRRRVHKYTMSGVEILKDNGYVAGPNIPIVPVYGMREYIDNMERFTGHVQSRMDSQRLYNAQVSNLAETSALSPRETLIFTPDQIPPGSSMAEAWARANVDRPPFLYANPLLDGEGNIVTAGPVAKLDPPQLAPVQAALLQIASSDLTEDDQDGAEQVKANTSEEAMQLAAARVDAKSGIYLDNIRQSIQREGEIYLGMAEVVYCEPGRAVDTMSEDGEHGQATLAEPYTDRTGKHFIRNDLSRGKYKVIASVTEATTTRRDKTVKSCLNTAQVAQAAGDNELARIATLTAVMNQEGEGMSDLQAYARKQLVAAGVVQPNEEEQKAMDEAAENQQPDAAQTALMAQAKELEASAGLKVAQTGKAVADTGLSEAKRIETLAKAHVAISPADIPGADLGLQAAA